jgi:putative methionine-R-sulfoxide reductase with GAF domain
MDDRDALQIVSDRRGTMYDPRVVDAFFEMHGHEMISTSAQPPPLASAVSAPVRQPPGSTDEGRDDRDLQAFFNLGRALSGATSTSQLGEVLWMHLRTHLPASVFVLYGYDGANDTIVAVHTAGAGASGVDTTPIPLGDRVSGWVAATGQTVMNSDARLDLGELARERSPLRSALAVPIVVDGRTAGVLSFYAETSNAFDDADRRLVEASGRALASTAPNLRPQLAVQEIDLKS